MKKLLIIFIGWLQQFTYQKVLIKDIETDGINKKVIVPVPELIINGKQYYKFKQAADIPQNRFVHYLDFREESKMGMTREEIITYCNELIKANNKGDLSRVGALSITLKDSVANCTPIEVLYNLASLVYFTKDEDLSCYDLDYNEEKIRLFKQVKNKGFFLTQLLENTLKVTGQSLPEDIEDYLRKSQVKLNAYRQMLTSE